MVHIEWNDAERTRSEMCCMDGDRWLVNSDEQNHFESLNEEIYMISGWWRMQKCVFLPVNALSIFWNIVFMVLVFVIDITQAIKNVSITGFQTFERNVSSITGDGVLSWFQNV